MGRGLNTHCILRATKWTESDASVVLHEKHTLIDGKRRFVQSIMADNFFILAIKQHIFADHGNDCRTVRNRRCVESCFEVGDS
ncbi:hypothetical protein DYH55_07480 [Methylovirgula sp. 4M-Z18]|nr:hypothetical protein DYH55_07480 [Methylovirgula sp. 4M-Z18]